MAKDLRSRKSGMGGTKPFAKKPEIDPRQEDFIRRAVEQNQGRDKDDLQKELFESIFPPKNIEDVFRCEILAIILTATEGYVIIINAL